MYYPIEMCQLFWDLPVQGRVLERRIKSPGSHVSACFHLETSLTHLTSFIRRSACRGGKEPESDTDTERCWDAREFPGAFRTLVYVAVSPPSSSMSWGNHRVPRWSFVRQTKYFSVISETQSHGPPPREGAESVTPGKNIINLGFVPRIPFGVLITSQSLWEMVKELFIKARVPY